MRRPSSRQRRLVVLTLALVVFGVAYFGGTKYKNRERTPPNISGLSIHPPSPLPSMDDMGDKAPVDRSVLYDHWSLLVLDPHRGEARSPALVRLLQIHNRLAVSPELQRQLHYLYLPVQGDETIQTSISALHENFTGLSGEQDRIEETFRRFGVDTDGEQASLYLIGPETNLHALFTPAEDAATIAQDITTLIRQNQ